MIHVRAAQWRRMTAGLDQWKEFCAAADRVRPQMRIMMDQQGSEDVFQALEGKGPTIAGTEPQPVDVLEAEKPERVSSEPIELATLECPNCHTLNCSVVECCAYGRLGCRITLVTCPYHRHGARVQHEDGSYGDVVPHMTPLKVVVRLSLSTVKNILWELPPGLETIAWYFLWPSVCAYRKWTQQRSGWSWYKCTRKVKPKSPNLISWLQSFIGIQFWNFFVPIRCNILWWCWIIRESKVHAMATDQNRLR